MKQLRIEQMKNEPADMFLIRAFAVSLPRMDDNARNALWGYLWQRAGAELLPPFAASNTSQP